MTPGRRGPDTATAALLRRLQDLPALRVWPKQIDAACFNQVRLALRRHGRPLRVALCRHDGLEMVLHDETWVCVDLRRSDFPVLAWSAFTRRERDSLTAPIDCELRVYDRCGGLLMGSAIEDLSGALRARVGHEKKKGRRCGPS